VPWEELEDLLALGPNEFEEAVAAILRELGFRRVRRTGGSGDLSVDITFRDKDSNLVAVQCKRYRPPNKVGSVEVQQFIGMAKLHHKAEVGMYVTTSDYTRSALQLAAQHGDIRLVNGLMLAEMLGNVLGAPGKEILDPRKALREAGLTAEELAEETRKRLDDHGEMTTAS
jgi:restriction endonuclease Mrr